MVLYVFRKGTDTNRTVSDTRWVELALNYAALGLDPSDFAYLIFEATEGLTDEQNYFWNDEYTFAQAGSPYNNSGVGNVQNIYELDTLRVETSVVPIPAAFPLLLTALAGLGLIGWRRRKVS